MDLWTVDKAPAKGSFILFLCLRRRCCSIGGLTVLSAQQAVEHLFDHDGVELDQLGKSLDDLVLE